MCRFVSVWPDADALAVGFLPSFFFLPCFVAASAFSSFLLFFLFSVPLAGLNGARGRSSLRFRFSASVLFLVESFFYLTIDDERRRVSRRLGLAAERSSLVSFF